MSLVYTDFCKSMGRKLVFIDIIIKYYNIKIKKNILVYAKFGKNHRNPKFDDFMKIYYTGESRLTSSGAHYIIGSLPTKNNYIQVNNYERIEKTNKGLDFKLYETLNSQWKLVPKTKFCCFIVSRGCDESVRTKFFNLLSEYKKVDSLGKYKNNCDILQVQNISHSNDSYYKVISQYKFIICFENTSIPHYLTEKIYNAYKSNTIPIYWGDPHVTEIFNEKTFINVEKNPNYEKTIDLIKLLDNNDDLYNEYFQYPPTIDSNLHDKRLDSSILQIKDLLNSD